MIPAWHLTSKRGFPTSVWEKCWLISTMPHGSGQGHVLIAQDDQPNSTWGYPPGSLRISSVGMDSVRIRRDVIPLMEKPDGD